MNKYVTRKNLMILNGFLGLLFSLVVLKNVIALAPNNEKEPVLDVISGEKHQASPGTARKNMNEFSIITTNNLFSSKRHTTEQSPAKALLPDPTKDWVLQGTASYPEGYHAIIADARQKDPKTGTFTIYDVKEGDKIVKNYPKGNYTVEFLEVTSGYVKFFIEEWLNQDLEEYAEDELTFEMYTWKEP